MIEDDIIELQNDRIRALEMVVGVMAKVIDATGNNVLDELRDVIDGRLGVLEAADQLAGAAGGASRRSLQLARRFSTRRRANRRQRLCKSANRKYLLQPRTCRGRFRIHRCELDESHKFMEQVILC